MYSVTCRGASFAAVYSQFPLLFFLDLFQDALSADHTFSIIPPLNVPPAPLFPPHPVPPFAPPQHPRYFPFIQQPTHHPSLFRSTFGCLLRLHSGPRLLQVFSLLSFLLDPLVAHRPISRLPPFSPALR